MKNESIQLENDFVYAMTGYKPNFDLLEKLEVKINTIEKTPMYNEVTLESNSPNVYLAGVVIGGLNTRGWFIENTRDHGSKIINDIEKKLAN